MSQSPTGPLDDSTTLWVRLDPPFVEPAPGSEFPPPKGRYLIRRRIGGGGMGVVFEAYDQKLRCPVAVKLVRPALFSQTALDRFKMEADILASLRRRRGIAGLYDFDVSPDPQSGAPVPYFVMEYVPGARRLNEFIAAHPRMRTRARLELFAKVCEAVGGAHSDGVVHRDLKPANILVDDADEPVVIDFGLALSMRHQDEAARLPSEHGSLVGTLAYMSPEQCDPACDPQSLTARSDVYSLGVVLYELLVGQLPYETDPNTVPQTEARRVIRHEPPVPPRGRMAGLHPRLERILLRSLRKDPQDRYENAAQLTAAIRRHLKFAGAIDLAFALPIIVLAVWLVDTFGVPLVYEWTSVNRWFQRSLQPAAAPEEPLKHTTVIAIDDHTDLAAIAREHGFDPGRAGFGEGQSQRMVWAAALDHLVDTGCKTVALDLFMTGPSGVPGADDAFEKALRRLQSRADVIFGLSCWPTASGGVTLLPRLQELGPRMGAARVTVDELGFWRIALIQQSENGAPFPSLSLATVAAHLHPGTDVRYDLLDRPDAIKVTFGAGRIALAFPFAPAVFPLAQTRSVTEPASEVDCPFEAPYDVGELVLDRIPSDTALDASTIELSRALDTPAKQLGRELSDRIVLLANLRHDTDDWHARAGGGLVCGCHAHAVAIDALLESRWVRTPTQQGQILILCASAVGGVAAVLLMRRRMLRAVAAAALLALLGAGACYAAFVADRYLINPAMPACAVLVSAVVFLATSHVRRLQLE